jgi:uncharacterized protein YbjT (DUF2867 family)
MKPDDLLRKIAAVDGNPSANANALKDYILIGPELLALWKAAAEYARLNYQINSNFNESMRDPIIHKAEWDAKVAMVDALKALEAK